MATAEYRWRHLALLISILLLFVSAPFVVSLHDGILIMNVISVSVLVAGSYALSERKYLFAICGRVIGNHDRGHRIGSRLSANLGLGCFLFIHYRSRRLFLRNYSFLCATKRSGYFR